MRYFQFNTQLKDEIDEKMLEMQMEQMREKRDALKTCKYCNQEMSTSDDGFYCSNKKCSNFDVDVLAIDVDVLAIDDNNLMARLDHALSFPQRFKQAGDWK
jgi:recombinational DNA repair protein RecR